MWGDPGIAFAGRVPYWAPDPESLFMAGMDETRANAPETIVRDAALADAPAIARIGKVAGDCRRRATQSMLWNAASIYAHARRLPSSSSRPGETPLSASSTTTAKAPSLSSIGSTSIPR